MKKVLIAGVFDLIHPGHLNFFKQAKKVGDYLMVVVTRDEVARREGKNPQHQENVRLENMRNISLVDEAILGLKIERHEEVIKIIKSLNPDVIALGYDQKPNKKTLEKLLKEEKTDIPVVTLKPYHPEKYKTSRIRDKM